MALVIEDGSMPEGANTYATLAEADAWLGARRFDRWPQPPVVPSPEPGDPDPPAGPDEPDPEPTPEPEAPGLTSDIINLKEAALIKAADYLNGLTWTGKKAGPGRIMAWPRMGATDADNYAIDPDIVPEQVKAACCYLAGQIFTGADTQPVLERGNRIASESVGGGLTTSYFDDATSRNVYSVLADLLKGMALGLDLFAGVGQGTAKGRTVIVNVNPGG